MSEESKMLPKSVEATPTLKAIAPCLRSRCENSPRREPRKVSFPEDESQLVTGYLEPANPWEYAENVTREELVSTYRASCEKHGTSPLSHVLDQLQTLDVDADRNECLDLKGESLVSPHCETLEEVLKRVQFKNINLEGTSLDDEGSVALFDMVEYYESATHLNISGNKNIGVRGWQACSRMIKKTQCLEQLEARNVTLNEQFMPILSRALRIGTQLQVLKLENCNLTGRPIIILAAALKLNSGLRELYLADNNLVVTDAIQLGGLLRANFTLQMLDISNNNIQDTGLGHISDGLMEQTSGQGLGILVLWNNHLTRNASKHFARAVARSQSLETLNVGQNMLTNECLHVMKDSLQQNRTLLRLGMQSTHLTCEGAIALAECIADNPVIQRIDLRDNNLKVAGLMALSLSMKVNTSVTQLDLDNVPKRRTDEDENTMDQYDSLVAEIRGYCSRNETAALEQEDTVDEGPTTGTPGRGRLSSNVSRKISLTCETLLRTTAMPPQPMIPDSGLLTEPKRGSGGRLRSPAPSPIPSPVSSPVPSPSRTRFQVSRVTELSPFLSSGQPGSPTSTSSSPITPPSLSSSPSRFFPSPATSRFRVTLVQSTAPEPTVTSPSGNVTVGFDFKNKKVVEDTPEIVVTGSAQNPESSQNVKITVKLDPTSDNLIIENEPSPSPASDTTDDTADLEVRSIMEPCSSVDEDVWNSKVLDTVTLLRRAGKDSVPTTKFPFPDVAKPAVEVHIGQGENTVKPPPPQRTRKISWIAPAAPVEPEESRTTSSLEKLLGLFHNPGSFFNKSQQQYKATAALLNPNSNISNGDSSESEGQHGATGTDVQRKDSSPIPDIINNNRGCDDNYNVQKLCDDVIKAKLCDSNGTKTVSPQPRVSEKDDTADDSGTELNLESNAIKNSPTAVSCRSEANGSSASDKSWSSFVAVQSAAATVRLVGGASGFTSYEADDGTSSLLLSDHSMDGSKEMELRQSNSL